ncbi:segregation/condensation protein A [Paenibacillus selenitireducens]|uniref:Segregation and condensation protein A n=1 Tax=Paenibacillus selenitireducens TaxID=1324314 RepID=A0A1T2XNZ4_9BACL|nr:segregation/condensation protein A [Paenibacillus selenitireducens]OPA81393.1 segregation/condensation protein A [Paenibacillus selenitireducens]
MTTVTYKLEAFEGPLDLLLHLIDKAEIDIQNVSISEITDQYMEYLHSMQELELDITSEFLVMAATLLSMKSKLLLPKPPVIELDEDFYYDPEDELDPRAELILKLMEYRKYKGIAEHLREMEQERSLIFSKEPEDLTPFMPTVLENPVKGLHTSDLIRAFQKALRKVTRRNTVARIHRDEISVKDRIRDVVSSLRQLGKGGQLLFSKLLEAEMDRHEVVVTFLAILELMKMKQIRCYQDHLFDDIVIQWKGDERIDGLQEAEINY